ncbi:MAG: hypothetical protein NC085_03605 [Muribaculaceae bacterium]|nr:hypothetical protein [Muribaculaceae bacterium]
MSVNEYIFKEFFKQTTEFLSKEILIVCLKNAIKICENKKYLQAEVKPRDASANIDMEKINKYDIIAEKLYERFLTDDIDTKK